MVGEAVVVVADGVDDVEIYSTKAHILYDVSSSAKAGVHAMRAKALRRQCYFKSHYSYHKQHLFWLSVSN